MTKTVLLERKAKFLTAKRSETVLESRIWTMIGKKMEEALNGQINAELYSSYLYLSMSAYFESLNLKGFANWMRGRAQDKLVHAMKIYDHINEFGGRAALPLVKAPPTEWNSPLAVFEDLYRHEQKVTGLIKGLVELAVAENDYTTKSFLQWFVDEQVKEGDSARQMLRKLELVAELPGGLFMIDRELTKRKFSDAIWKLDPRESLAQV